MPQKFKIKSIGTRGSNWCVCEAVKCRYVKWHKSVPVLFKHSCTLHDSDLFLKMTFKL